MFLDFQPLRQQGFFFRGDMSYTKKGTTGKKFLAEPVTRISGFGWNIYVFTTPEEYHAIACESEDSLLSHEDFEDYLHNKMGISTMGWGEDGKQYAIIGINPENIHTLIALIQTVVHEVTHIMLSIAGGHGYDPVKEQEPLCYLIDDVSGSILEALSKKYDKVSILFDKTYYGAD